MHAPGFLTGYEQARQPPGDSTERFAVNSTPPRRSHLGEGGTDRYRNESSGGCRTRGFALPESRRGELFMNAAPLALDRYNVPSLGYFQRKLSGIRNPQWVLSFRNPQSAIRIPNSLSTRHFLFSNFVPSHGASAAIERDCKTRRTRAFSCSEQSSFPRYRLSLARGDRVDRLWPDAATRVRQLRR
jgi:hypothetical protein